MKRIVILFFLCCISSTAAAGIAVGPVSYEIDASYQNMLRAEHIRRTIIVQFILSGKSVYAEDWTEIQHLPGLADGKSSFNGYHVPVFFTAKHLRSLCHGEKMVYLCWTGNKKLTVALYDEEGNQKAAQTYEENDDVWDKTESFLINGKWIQNRPKVIFTGNAATALDEVSSQDRLDSGFFERMQQLNQLRFDLDCILGLDREDIENSEMESIFLLNEEEVTGWMAEVKNQQISIPIQYATLSAIHGAYYWKNNAVLCRAYLSRALVWADIVVRTEDSPELNAWREEIYAVCRRYGAFTDFPDDLAGILPEILIQKKYDTLKYEETVKHPPIESLFDFFSSHASSAIIKGARTKRRQWINNFSSIDAAVMMRDFDSNMFLYNRNLMAFVKPYMELVDYFYLASEWDRLISMDDAGDYFEGGGLNPLNLPNWKKTSLAVPIIHHALIQIFNKKASVVPVRGFSATEPETLAELRDFQYICATMTFNRLSNTGSSEAKAKTQRLRKRLFSKVKVRNIEKYSNFSHPSIGYETHYRKETKDLCRKGEFNAALPHALTMADHFLDSDIDIDLFLKVMSINDKTDEAVSLLFKSQNKSFARDQYLSKVLGIYELDFPGELNQLFPIENTASAMDYQNRMEYFFRVKKFDEMNRVANAFHYGGTEPAFYQAVYDYVNGAEDSWDQFKSHFSGQVRYLLHGNITNRFAASVMVLDDIMKKDDRWGKLKEELNVDPLVDIERWTKMLGKPTEFLKLQNSITKCESYIEQIKKMDNANAKKTEDLLWKSYSSLLAMAAVHKTERFKKNSEYEYYSELFHQIDNEANATSAKRQWLKIILAYDGVSDGLVNFCLYHVNEREAFRDNKQLRLFSANARLLNDYLEKYLEKEGVLEYSNGEFKVDWDILFKLCIKNKEDKIALECVAELYAADPNMDYISYFLVDRSAAETWIKNNAPSVTVRNNWLKDWASKKNQEKLDKPMPPLHELFPDQQAENFAKNIR